MRRSLARSFARLLFVSASSARNKGILARRNCGDCNATETMFCKRKIVSFDTKPNSHELSRVISIYRNVWTIDDTLDTVPINNNFIESIELDWVDIMNILNKFFTCTEKKLIGWYSKPIIYYANSTLTAKKIWWFNKSLMLFSCQLCYFDIENWLSVYYVYRFAGSLKFSAVFFSMWLIYMKQHEIVTFWERYLY